MFTLNRFNSPILSKFTKLSLSFASKRTAQWRRRAGAKVLDGEPFPYGITELMPYSQLYLALTLYHIAIHVKHRLTFLQFNLNNLCPGPRVQ